MNALQASVKKIRKNSSKKLRTCYSAIQCDDEMWKHLNVERENGFREIAMSKYSLSC